MHSETKATGGTHKLNAKQEANNNKRTRARRQRTKRSCFAVVVMLCESARAISRSYRTRVKAHLFLPSQKTMFSFSCIVCVGSDPGSVSNHHAMCSKQATTYSCAAVVVCIPRPKVTGETSKMELLHNYWRFGKLGKAPNHMFLFTLFNFFCRRPYRVECTGSLSTSEFKQHRARLVLGWGTAWEDLRVLSAFSSLLVLQPL